MELLKLKTDAKGGMDYVKNAVNYVLDERSVMSKGFGVDPHNANGVINAFEKTAEFWDNSGKNALIHAIASFTTETAPTAEKAMELTERILEPITADHLALSSVHSEERSGSSNHTHNIISTTNINNGKMLNSDNTNNDYLAQRMADVTGQSVQLVVDYGKGKEWTCPKIFVPQDDEG